MDADLADFVGRRITLIFPTGYELTGKLFTVDCGPGGVDYRLRHGKYSVIDSLMMSDMEYMGRNRFRLFSTSEILYGDVYERMYICDRCGRRRYRQYRIGRRSPHSVRCFCGGNLIKQKGE